MKSRHSSVFLVLPLVLWSCSGEPPKATDHAREKALLILTDKAGSFSESNCESLRKGCIAAAKTLAPQDLVAVVGFDSHPTLVLDFTEARLEDDISHHIRPMQADGGKRLQTALVEVQRLFDTDGRVKNCAVKHVILFSDGDVPEEDYETVVRRMQATGITVSTICFASPNFDPVLMNQIATWGKGRLYFSDRFTTATKQLELETRTAAALAPKGN